MYVRTHSEGEVFQNLSRVSAQLHGLVSTKDDQVYIGNSATAQSLVQKLIMDKDSDSLKKIILDACFRAESVGPGAGDLILSNVNFFLDHLIKLRRFDRSSWGEIVKNSRSITSDSFMIHSHKLNRSVFSSFVDSIPDPARSVINEALEVGSPSTSYKVSRSNRINTSCTRDSGYKFHVASPLRDTTGKGQEWTRRNVDVIVIDGIIESVTEIHHILERYSSTRQPLCIVCRNAAPEVLTTLRYNNLRGTLDVVLCTFGYDELRANLLVDAAICCGVDVVSSLQGDLINTSISKIGVVDRITLSDSLFTLQNSRSTSSVSEHRKRLQQKYDGSDPMVGAVIEKRLASLVNDIVRIEVGLDTLDKDPRAIELIDSFLRSMTAYMKSGYILRKDMLSFLNSNGSIRILSGAADKEISWNLPDMLPTASFLSFVRYTIQLSVDLIGIGLIVRKE